MTRIGLAALLSLLLVGCLGTDAEEQWLEQAHAASEEARSVTSPQRSAQARRALAQALSVDVRGDIDAVHRRAVRQDLFFQLATLELRASLTDQAIASATRGLQEGESEDVFTANLYIVRGRAHESLDHAREAADDYYRALRINERLLNRIRGDHR